MRYAVLRKRDGQYREIYSVIAENLHINVNDELEMPEPTGFTPNNPVYRVDRIRHVFQLCEGAGDRQRLIGVNIYVSDL